MPPKRKAKAKEEVQISAEEEIQSEPEPPVKKAKASKKTEKAASGAASSSSAVGATSEGESYVDLGKKKRATVREFKSTVYVDIREYYGDDKDPKPSKKGISLSVEQWEALKSNMDTIDKFVQEVSK